MFALFQLHNNFGVNYILLVVRTAALYVFISLISNTRECAYICFYVSASLSAQPHIRAYGSKRNNENLVVAV